MTIDQKKAYLNQYKWLRMEEKELNEELECLRLETLPGAIKYSDMPKGSVNLADLSDHMVRLEEVTSKLEALLREKWQKRKEISASIEQMPDETYKLLLRYKFLSEKDRTLEEVSELIGYSDRHIYRLYNAALEQFEPMTVER